MLHFTEYANTSGNPVLSIPNWRNVSSYRSTGVATEVRMINGDVHRVSETPESISNYIRGLLADERSAMKGWAR